MSIQEASRQVLADIERAQKARQDYANANAAQYFDYKVDSKADVDKPSPTNLSVYAAQGDCG